MDDNEFEQIFVGREGEQRRIINLILSTMEDGGCRSVKLKGPGGVGKTTLFNSILHKLNQERQEGGSRFNRLSQTHEIYATFFCVDSNFQSLAYIWQKMFEGLIYEQSNFFIDLALKFIVKLFSLLNASPQIQVELANIVFKKSPKRPQNLQYLTLEDLHQIYSTYVWEATDIQDLIQFVISQKRFILTHQEIVSGKPMRLEPTQLNRIVEFLTVLDLDSTMLLDLKGQTEHLIKDDDSAIDWYNWISLFSGWVTGKQTFFVIGIDEISKIAKSSDQQDTRYSQLFTLMTILKSRLRRVFFVFIDTNDGWNKLETYLNTKTDLSNQVSAFMKDAIELDELPRENALQVFQKRIELFWKRNGYQTFSCLPFNFTSLQYVYQYRSQKLRETMNLLAKIWNELRAQPAFTPIFTEFECMRVVRSLLNDFPPLFSARDLHPFEKKMLYDIFWKDPDKQAPNYFSNIIELTLEKAFNVLKNESPRIVSHASRPTFRIQHEGELKNRKPDVFVELFGAEGTEAIRNIELQIKMYHPSKYVKLKELESTFDLIQHGKSDLVVLLMTGEGLEANAISAIQSFEQNRFWKPEPLNYDEELALIFLSYYDQIVGKNLSDPKHVRKILNEFMKWDAIVDYIKRIPKYTKIISAEQVIKVSEEPPKTAELPAVTLDQKIGQEDFGTRKEPAWISLLSDELKLHKQVVMEIFKILWKSPPKNKTFTDTFLCNHRPENLGAQEIKDVYNLLRKTPLFEQIARSSRLTNTGIELINQMKEANWIF